MPITTKRNKVRRSSKRQQLVNTNMPRAPRIAMGDRQVFGFPPIIETKLRYVDTYALVSTAGSLAKQVMYLNSTFDPDNTGTGHQPLYRDTYAAIYDQYSVVHCHAKITFQSLAVATSNSIGVVIDDDNSTSTTPTTLMEQSRGKHHLLPPLSGSLSNHTFVVEWDCKRDLGIDPYASETYKTINTSNPTEIAALLLWSVPADGSSTTTIQVQVELVQTVLWTELITPTQS
jgi:hypothetical protein